MYKANIITTNIDHRTLDIDGLQLSCQAPSGGRSRSPGSHTNTSLLPIQLPGESVHLVLQLVPQTQQLGVSQVNGILVSHPGVPPAVVALPELHMPADSNLSTSMSTTLITLRYLIEATGNKALFLSRGPQYIGFR